MARARRGAVCAFMEGHPPQAESRGVVLYASGGDGKGQGAFVAFTGRGGNPIDSACGMHLSAAEAAAEGWQAMVASAHEDSRHRALAWMLGLTAAKVMIVGHSHGADHASMLAAEYYRRTGRRADALVTLDPMNSPFPFPLQRIKDRAAVANHVNYYQRNAPWFGGSIAEANVNQDVSDPQQWPSWSRLLAGDQSNRGITHTTIDEDLFLHGEISRWRLAIEPAKERA